MVPPPHPPHCDIGSRLTRSAMAFIIANNVMGDLYHPRAAIWIDGTYVEPDMMYVSRRAGACLLMNCLPGWSE